MTLKFSHVVAKNTPKGKAADRFAELVREKSGGKIAVQVFPNSELFKDAEELEALQRGEVDFIAPATGKFATVAPAWDAAGLAYMFTSEAAVNRFLDPDNPVARELFESLRPSGLLGAAIWGNGWRNFTNTRRPLKSPADFEGVKVLTTTKSDEAFVKALGGSGQSMAFSDHFGVLALGGADGQYNSWSNIQTQQFHEIQKYATVSRGGTYITYGVATNAKWWDSLGADDRKRLGDAMREASAYANQLGTKDNADALAEIKRTNRLDFYELSDEENKAFQQAAESVIAQWEPKTGKEIIAKLKALN